MYEDSAYEPKCAFHSHRGDVKSKTTLQMDNMCMSSAYGPTCTTHIYVLHLDSKTTLQPYVVSTHICDLQMCVDSAHGSLYDAANMYMVHLKRNVSLHMDHVRVDNVDRPICAIHMHIGSFALFKCMWIVYMVYLESHVSL